METKKDKPLCELVKATFSHNEVLIMEATGISEFDYRSLVFENGCQYAEIMTEKDADSYHLLTASGYYWSWWRNEFNKRNAKFIANFNMQAGKQLALSFRIFQSAERLCYGSLNESQYASLMGNVFKERRRKEVAK